MILQKVDPEIQQLIRKEKKRLESTLMMIPSENYTSKAVEEAVGSCFGNKYAEGYPLKRFYQGQRYADELEKLVQDRARTLFGVEHVNVQPYSGSPANFAVFHALMQPGETLMGLSLSFGGHLTHGASVSATSRYFRSVSYTLGKDGRIDYDAVLELAQKEKPTVIIAGTTAYPRLIEWKKFSQIAKKVGAYLLADISHLSGLIAGGAYPSPVPYVHVVTTTTHKTLRGPRGALIMVTRNGLEKDPQLADKIDKAVFPGLQGGPHLNTIAGIGVALHEAMQEEFKTYAASVIQNAKSLASALQVRGVKLVSGGTDSHLILADLSPYRLLGNTVAEALEYVGIILNKNAVPYDTNPPFYPSGIRLGTPGVTSRGMGVAQMETIADCIVTTIKVLQKSKKELAISSMSERKSRIRNKIIENAELDYAKKQITLLARKFPIKDQYFS